MSEDRKVAFDFHKLLDQMEDNPRTDGWENEDFGPDGLEVAPPAGVFGAAEEGLLRITTRPSVDVLNEEIGPILASSFADYILGDRESGAVELRVESKRHGLLAFEYEYERDGEVVEDFWDYQGPLKAKVEVKFRDKPLSSPSPEIRSALEAAFLSHGFDATDPKQAPYSEALSGFRFSFQASLKDITCNPLYVPRKQASLLTLGGDQYTKAILEKDPEVFLHW